MAWVSGKEALSEDSIPIDGADFVDRVDIRQHVEDNEMKKFHGERMYPWFGDKFTICKHNVCRGRGQSQFRRSRR